MITVNLPEEMVEQVLHNNGYIEICPDVGRLHIYYYGEQKSPPRQRPEDFHLIKHEVHEL